ncbi:hypothetical protein [Streptacidiphilus anmyonensis]|uniref:hypothetical protein n=1 Tax=Streptacidiphilus anmyonensis TaxID=405782 RepID=UPI0005A6C6D1|nr:hypothetical protein [Streptacidiphilus anmyonensis]
MFGGRAKKVVALGTAAVALAGGAVLGAVGTASATTHHGPGDHRRHCDVVQGHWVRTWHPAGRDRHGRQHPGYWTRTRVPAHQVCNR